jgi:hypothetical protein
MSVQITHINPELREQWHAACLSALVRETALLYVALLLHQQLLFGGLFDLKPPPDTGLQVKIRHYKVCPS